MANILLRYRDTRSRYPVPGSIVERLVRGVSRLLGLARERRALARLSDDLLRDIGLSRHEVEAECRKPWWRP
jgi:uncharacterized protein YjiS (DUF1127 family)